MQRSETRSLPVWEARSREVEEMVTLSWDFRWSPAEKVVARKAFDLALSREFDEVTREVKRMAANLNEKSALWDLENFLTRSRMEIDRKYDYRYSVLTVVFGNLIREGRLTEEDLHGLGEDKLDFIRRITSA